MKKLFSTILLFVTGILILFAIPVFAKDEESIRGGFYTSIYERVSSEIGERAAKAVVQKMGITDSDMVAIARGEKFDSLSDYQGVARIKIMRDWNDERIALYRSDLTKLAQAERLLAGAAESERPALQEERDRLRKSLLMSDSETDQTRQLLAAQEQLVSDFAFERSLAEFEISLEEETKATEIFANGDLGDMAGSSDVHLRVTTKEVVDAMQTIPLIGTLFGDVTDVSVDQISGATKFDLIRDLEAIDYLIFGVNEMKNLSPGGDGIGFDFSALRNKGKSGDGDESPESVPPGSTGSTPTSTPSSDDDTTTVDTPGTGSGPATLDQPLSVQDVYDTRTILVSGTTGSGYDSGGECRFDKDIDLDFGPASRIDILEKRQIANEVTAVTGSTGEIPADISGLAIDDETKSGVASVTSVESPADLGITEESLTPEDEFKEEDCWAADFDIQFCYKFESGTYGNPKIYKDDSCLACHVNAMVDTFKSKLLPYSLKARKNEGLIGGGSYCNEANEAEMGMQLLAIAKPLNFYKDACYPKVDGSLPEIDLSKNKMRGIQVAYLKVMLNLQDSIDALYVKRANLVRQRRDTKGTAGYDTLTSSIYAMDLNIALLESKRDEMREKNLVVLEQWRGLQEDYEKETGCGSNIGGETNDEFKDVLDTYHKDLLSTVSSAGASETTESVVTERILSMEPESIAAVYDQVADYSRSVSERYADNRLIKNAGVRFDAASQGASLLEREIMEMASHFSGMKDALESLRRPEDGSVLKKLSEKETP